MSGTIDAVTIAIFRKDLPEFTNPLRWKDADIQLYLDIVNPSLDKMRWGQFWKFGIENWVAHFLVLEDQDKRASDRGSTPGQSAGPATGKTVGSVSASYAEYATLEDKAGFFNLTTYGKRYIRFARMAGKGGIQVTGGGRGLPAFVGGWP